MDKSNEETAIDSLIVGIDVGRNLTQVDVQIDLLFKRKVSDFCMQPCLIFENVPYKCADLFEIPISLCRLPLYAELRGLRDGVDSSSVARFRLGNPWGCGSAKSVF